MYKNSTTIYLMRKISFLSVLIILTVLVFARSVYATPQQEVLGYSLGSNTFPKVTAGTGFLLPDSPLYFADKVFQNLKLAVAFTSESKVTVQTQILGERMAELREMYSRRNNEGIVKALWELEKEAKNLAASVKAVSNSNEAQLLAKKANDVLRDYRVILAAASTSSSDELSLKLDSASHSLLVSKVEIEDFLTIADQEDAIASDLEMEVENAVLGTSTKAEKTEKKIQNLEKRATKAEQIEKKKLEQKAKANAKKLEAKKVLEKRKQLEEKRKKLIEERKKKLEAAREALKKAREAALKFKEAQKAERELKNETEDEAENETEDKDKSKQEDDSSNSGSGSSNSGSGSSNSGSDSSGKNK